MNESHTNTNWGFPYKLANDPNYSVEIHSRPQSFGIKTFYCCNALDVLGISAMKIALRLFKHTLLMEGMENTQIVPLLTTSQQV